MSRLTVALYSDNMDYCRRRVLGTIMNSSVGPITVFDFYDRESFEVKLLKTGEKIKLQASEIYLEPVKLGYVNYPNGAVFLMRMPCRDWYQGFVIKNSVQIQEGRRNSGVLYREQLHDCISNRYPTLKNALITSTISRIAVAWDKKWACKTSTLFYKGDEVGRIVEEKPDLSVNFQFLQEELDFALERDKKKAAYAD